MSALPSPSQLAAWLREYAQDAVMFSRGRAAALETAAILLEVAEDKQRGGEAQKK